MIALRYLGNQGAWLAGVPPRDLTEADIEKCGQQKESLIQSGLYAYPKKVSKPKLKPKTNKLEEEA